MLSTNVDSERVDTKELYRSSLQVQVVLRELESFLRTTSPQVPVAAGLGRVGVHLSGQGGNVGANAAYTCRNLATQSPPAVHRRLDTAG